MRPQEVALKPATGLCPPQSRHIVVCIFCCVTFCLVALHSMLSLNNGIVTLTSCFGRTARFDCCLYCRHSHSKSFFCSSFVVLSREV